MPTRERVHQDAVLSNYAIQYSQAGIYIADQAMPVKIVAKESDKYFKFYLKDVISIPNRTQRADGAESAEISYDLETGTYQCEAYSAKDIVTDRTRKNADQPLNPDMDATRILTDAILLDREYRVSRIMFDTSTTFASYTAALSGGDRWDDYENSDPFAKVELAIDSVVKNSLKMPNTMILGRDVYKKLKHHPDILERIKYSGGPTNPALIDTTLLAQCFGLERVLVGSAVYNTANKGQTLSAGYVWGKYCGIYYIEPNPGIKTVSAGITFRSENFTVRKWREDSRGGDMIEVEMIDDEVVPAAGAGYVYSTVVS